MKTFLTFLVLLFSSSVLADDISDFEIDGMSIEDSLLDYFSITEIKNSKEYSYDNIPYTWKYFNSSSTLYDDIKITFLKNDKNYIIQSLAGQDYYNNNSRNEIQNCYQLKDQIIQEISKDFKLKGKNIKKEHSGYPGSFTNTYYFKFEEGSQIAVACYDFSLKENFRDKLMVKIDSAKFAYALNNQEY